MEQKLDRIPETAANCNLNYLPCAALNILRTSSVSDFFFQTKYSAYSHVGGYRYTQLPVQWYTKVCLDRGVRRGKRLIVDPTTHGQLKAQVKECVELSILSHILLRNFVLNWQKKDKLSVIMLSLNKPQKRASCLTTF